MLKRLKLVTHAPSLAGVETPGLRAAAHLAQGLSARGPRRARHSRRFLRLSCGIEDAEDIIADLEQALAKASELPVSPLFTTFPIP